MQQLTLLLGVATLLENTLYLFNYISYNKVTYLERSAVFGRIYMKNIKFTLHVIATWHSSKDHGPKTIPVAFAGRGDPFGKRALSFKLHKPQ